MAGNGGNGISPGYLFLPSDQLLLDFYLRKKVDGQEADDQALGAIPTVHLFGRDAPPPWLLHPAAVAPSSSRKSSKVSWRSSGIVPRKVTEWFYCFARTSRRGPGSCRTTSCGTWLTSGGDKRVTAESDDDEEEGGEEGVVTTLGYKSSLAFKIPAAGGGCSGGSKWIPTCWVMNEFKLIHRSGHPDVIGRMEEADQLVLCRIRCTKILKSGLGSRVGEEPPEKRQRSERSRWLPPAPVIWAWS